MCASVRKPWAVALSVMNPSPSLNSFQQYHTTTRTRREAQEVEGGQDYAKRRRRRGGGKGSVGEEEGRRERERARERRPAQRAVRHGRCKRLGLDVTNSYH
eukprot:3021416-Rhodomonas_salina.2